MKTSGLFVFVLEKCVFQHIFGHISGTTDPIGLKFKVRADFGHRVPHTKLQPLRLNDAGDIWWLIRNARLSKGFQRTLEKKSTLHGTKQIVSRQEGEISNLGMKTRIKTKLGRDAYHSTS